MLAMDVRWRAWRLLLVVCVVLQVGSGSSSDNVTHFDHTGEMESRDLSSASPDLGSDLDPIPFTTSPPNLDLPTTPPPTRTPSRRPHGRRRRPGGRKKNRKHGSGIKSYVLRAPDHYIAFTGDLKVEYAVSGGPNASLLGGEAKMVSLKTGKAVAFANIEAGFKKGVALFPCGVIDHAGKFVFKMFKTGTNRMLAESNVLVVDWPEFVFELPRTHVTQSYDVTMKVTKVTATCAPIHASGKYRLDVVYHGLNDSETGGIDHRSSFVTVKKQIGKLNELKDILLHCNYFDQAGMYQVLLKYVHGTQSVIASSNIMTTTWNDNYELRPDRNSIFPCKNTFIIRYKHPPCIGNRDKIRLYSRVFQAQRSVASPANLTYLTESRVKVGRRGTTFKCGLFHEDVTGYCFKYVSIALSGAVSEKVMKCVSSLDKADPVIDGGWSDWSSWGACTATCGKGRHNRFRICNNPPPENGGHFCKGSTLEWAECGSDSEPCRAPTTLAPFGPYTANDRCRCGCSLNHMQGQIVAQGSCRGTSVWIIQVGKGHVVRLTFDLFNLKKEQQWVKVRDGDSRMSVLLMYEKGLSEKLHPVTSTDHTMLVEFRNSYEDSSFGHGFVATYSALVDNSTAALAAMPMGEQKKLWESTVTLIGISLCGVIIIATVAFVCHHRVCRKDKTKYKQTSSQSPLTSGSNFERGGSIHSGRASTATYDQLPPMKRERPVGVASSSVSDGESMGHRMKRKEKLYGVESEKRSRQSSLASHGSPDHITPLLSPYESKPDEFLHEPGMFQASPYHKAQVHQSPAGSRDKENRDQKENKGHREHKHHKHHKRDRDRGRDRDPDGRKDRDHKHKHRHHKDRHQKDPKDHRKHERKRSKSPLAQSSPTRADGQSNPTTPTNKIPPTGTPRRTPDSTPNSLRRMIPAPPGPPTPTVPGAVLFPQPVPPSEGDANTINAVGDLVGPRRKNSKEKQPPSMITINENITFGMKNGKPKKQRQETTPGATSPTSSSSSKGKISDKVRAKGGKGDRRGGTPERQVGNKGVLADSRASTPSTTGSHPGTPTFRNSSNKPVVKPLPLRCNLRPDGQSPEQSNPEASNTNTPSSSTAGLSPMLAKRLQRNHDPAGKDAGTPSDIISLEDDGFEFDEFIPHVEGSFFGDDANYVQVQWPTWDPALMEILESANLENFEMEEKS